MYLNNLTKHKKQWLLLTFGLIFILTCKYSDIRVNKIKFIYINSIIINEQHDTTDISNDFDSINNNKLQNYYRILAHIHKTLTKQLIIIYKKEQTIQLDHLYKKMK